MVSGGWYLWNLNKGSWIMESGLWNTMLGRLLVVIYFSQIHILCQEETQRGGEERAKSNIMMSVEKR